MADERTAGHRGEVIPDALERARGNEAKIKEYRETIRNQQMTYRSRRLTDDDGLDPPSGGDSLERERDW